MMAVATDDSIRYYYRHQFDPNQLPVVQEPMTTRIFVQKLISLQVFSACVLVLSAVLQAIAIATNDWFVLNVNEFIPTSKGGLWNYCYVSSAISYTSQFSCMRYEDLPNFFVFVTSRLYDSRILLVCSCGFCALLICVEFFGIFSLMVAEKRGDIFDTIVAKRSSRLRAAEKTPTEYLYPSSPKARTQTRQSSKVMGMSQEDATNSARFTTSIIVNANPELYQNYRTIKPTGYFAYLAIALITMVGSVMDFVLKVSGFALFDAYVNSLLSFNSVFLAYRSYSYWMMIVAIALLVFFWLFKVFSTRYVVNLTKKLLQARDQLGGNEYSAGFDPRLNIYKPGEYGSAMKRGYNNDISLENGLYDPNNINTESGYRIVRSFPVQPSFIFDVESSRGCHNAFAADDISTNSFTSENFKRSYPSLNHNQTPNGYYQEYVKTDPTISRLSMKVKPAEETSDSDQVVYVKRREETETIIKPLYPSHSATTSTNPIGVPIYGFSSQQQMPTFKSQSPSIASDSTCYI